MFAKELQLTLLSLTLLELLLLLQLQAVNGQAKWPRETDLYAFYPLTGSKAYSTELTGKWSVTHMSSAPNAYTGIGPFGVPSTSYVRHTSEENYGILTTINNAFTVTKSFTVSLFLQATKTNTAEYGLFCFRDESGNRDKNSFAMSYIPNQSILRIYAAGQRIGDYKVIQTDMWTFLAVIFDYDNFTLSIYTRHGRAYATKVQPNLVAASMFNSGGFTLGSTARTVSNIPITDAVTCLMIYRAPLSTFEIAQAHDACAIAHGTPGCGVPKLPLTALPPQFNKPQVPEHGQFPWMVSIRDANNKHVCEGTIVDEFRIISSASCVKNANPITFWKAIVGEHDLLQTDTGEVSHQIKQAFPHPDGLPLYDMAIIELSTPINMANKYANPICLIHTKQELDHAVSGYYFAGWGSKARPTLVSESIMRYVNGDIYSDEECIDMYKGSEIKQSYNSSIHFCFEVNSKIKGNLQAPCDTDLGGPLMRSYTDKLQGPGSYKTQQIGVFTVHDGNCSDTVPSLFASKLRAEWVTYTLACHIPGTANLHPTVCPMPQP